MKATDAAAPLPLEAASRDVGQCGPLLAIRGLCGGAGATTLSYLVARAAAEDMGAPVLVCDTSGQAAALSTYAGVSTPRSLPAAARALARDEQLDGGLFAEAAPGLRLIGRTPEREDGAEAGAVRALLADARRAHVLTVVDCATADGLVDGAVLEAASHVAFVVPATPKRLRSARQALGSVPRDPNRSELLIARWDPKGPPAPTVDLATLANERRATLVLMPDLPDLVERPIEPAVEEAGVTLLAIISTLRR